MSLSIIIPSYKNPKYLDLCLKSIIETQEDKNEIIVVLDGYVELSKDVIERYKNHISIIEFTENLGMPHAINYGVYNASNKLMLIVSEDNVFPKDWQKELKLQMAFMDDNEIITINQIEPLGPSIYNVEIHNFGTTAEEFDIQKFWKEEPNYRSARISEDGSTFPFLISKKNFMKIGGFDIDYPSPFVVDWDFFLKAELSGLELVRWHRFFLYHFVSKSTKNRNGYIENPNEKVHFFEGEQKAAEYFEYKWGFRPKRDKNNKCKQFISF